MLSDYPVVPPDEEGVKGEPRRSLARHLPDGREIFVSTRMNLDLLAEASQLPLMLVKPVPAPEHVLEGGDSLTGPGSIASYELLEELAEALTAASCPAAYLGEQHGDGRRDFYFTTEAPNDFRLVVADVAARKGVEVGIEEMAFTNAAQRILPIELIGRLRVPVPPGATMNARFAFWGDYPNLEKLQKELERRGFKFLELNRAIRELRMSRDVPVDGPGFLALLREIVPLSRNLRCSYRGEETVDGFQPFLLTAPTPQHYYPPRQGLGARLFGRKGL